MKKKIIIAVFSIFVFLEIVIIILLLNITPMKLKRTVFTYQYGEEISTNIEDYVVVNSSIKDNIELHLDNVSNEVGNYQASISYYNRFYPFEIHIVDTIKPKATLKQAEWNILVNQKLYAKDLIGSIEDASKTTVYFESGEEYVSYVKEGAYVERIIVEDVHGNKSASLRVKINVRTEDLKPYFEGIEDTIIKVGDSINLYENIKAIDTEDGDITSLIKISGTVNNKKAGDYVVTYTVTDSHKNTVKKLRIITVE